MKLPVDIFKALADETRLRILALLLEVEELCVCDIISAVKLPQSTVSRHLAYLRRCGLVNDRRCGLWMYYSLARGNNSFQRDLLALLRAHIATSSSAATDRNCLAAINDKDRCN